MQASKLNGKLPLPLYGLAQIMVRQREYTNAVSLLERALAEVPGWPDALNMLGLLYPQVERKGQAAVSHFQEAAEADSKSGVVWEMLGELLSTTDPPGQQHDPFRPCPLCCWDLCAPHLVWPTLYER
jgi:Flp pilus assembly protein TadD